MRPLQTAGEPQRIQTAETGIERTGERLAAGDQRSPSPSSIAIVFFIVEFGLVLDKSFDNVFDIPDFDQDIFRFQVGVDDATLAVEIVQAEQDLLGDLLDQRHGDAPMVPALDQAQQVFPEHFEDHADMQPVRPLVLE